MTANLCPFCTLPPSRVWARNDVCVAFYDGYPVTEGHSLVVPKQHVSSVFELGAHDQAELWALVNKVRADLRLKYGTTDFNIGINDGPLVS